MRYEVLVLKVALVMLKDHGNYIFSENLDKSLYFGVGFITVIFQLKKSWLLHKNLIPSFLESKYGILGPIFQSGNIFNKPVYIDFFNKIALCVIPFNSEILEESIYLQKIILNLTQIFYMDTRSQCYMKFWC